MSIRFQAEVADLAGKGIALSDLTPEEVERLVHACDKCTSPFTYANAELVGIPIHACEGVVFWKMTVGASVWLDQYAKRWWLDTGMRKAYFWAIVYALIHGREKDAFVSLVEESVAHKRITQEALKLACHEDEITQAVDYALGITDEKPNAQKAALAEQESDWASVVMRLESQTGIPAEKWIWERSLDYAKRTYFDLRQFAEAQAGRRTGHAKDELDYAMNALARLRAEIIQRVTDERAANASAEGEQK